MTKHVIESLVKLVANNGMTGEEFEEWLSELIDTDSSGDVYVDEIWTVEHE
jgi:hypothetical protein